MPLTSLTGRWLGRYLVGELLGAGGMGEVYRAKDSVLNREVAIKVLPQGAAETPGHDSRFELEAQAVARLSHPNILSIHDFGESDGTSFAVTELLNGFSLRAEIGRGPIARSEGLRIAAEIADGLDAAHRAGVTHRDLKPENVFVCDDGRVKILDFGLARIETDESESDVSDSLGPTRTLPGTVMGTIGYMAPEQVRGETADPLSDIFALGCVLYELLSGRRAFGGSSPAEVMAAILRDEPAELGDASVPVTLEAVLRKALAKQPEQRFQSASELGAALRGISDDTSFDMGSASARPSIPGIAVLPFANLSTESQQEYFCDGMAEEIISALARLDGLRVIARTSSFAFKGLQRDIREIGTELGVQTILEGSVRKAGDRLRITTQLIDVRDGSNLWSRRFDRQLEDVFAIQDEISQAIVESLEVRLIGSRSGTIIHPPTESLDAHSAFLKGVYFWNKLSADGHARSREFLEEAIAIDPEYASAHAWLAAWHGSQAFWGETEPRQAYDESLKFAHRALELDQDIAEARSLVGVELAFLQRDFEGALGHLRRAVEIAPSNAWVLSNLAVFWLISRRYDKALEAIREARRLDPLSPTLNSWAGAWLGMAGQLSEGISVLQEQLVASPDHWLPHHYLAETLCRAGSPDEALPSAQRAVELSGHSSIAVTQLIGILYALKAGGQDQYLDLLVERADRSYVPPCFFAWIALGRGESANAIAHLRRAAEIGDVWLPFHRLVPEVLVPRVAEIEALLDEIGLR